MVESTLRLHVPQASPVLAVHNPDKPKRKRRKKGDKPEKPYPDFPLFPHATKRWAKKINRQTVYFGSWADGPEAALESYRQYLKTGQTRAQAQGATLDDAVQHFQHAKREAVAGGELAERTWQDYAATCRLLLEHFGRTRLAKDLTAEDFRKYRAKLATSLGPVTLGNEIIRVRVLLNYIADKSVKLIPAPIDLGNAFDKPSAKTLRKARAAKGPRMFEAAELRRVIYAAKLPLRCWVLLGVNAGYGNADCARLPLAALDLDGGWVTYHREKTGIPRRAKLWPETVEAIREWLAVRPKAKSADLAELMFLTPEGESFYNDVRGTAVDIGKAMGRLLLRLKIPQNFYALRHTFETVGGEARDQVAVNHIMGHVDASMSGTYRERVHDDRLEAVGTYIRGWLFSDHDAHVHAWIAHNAK